MDKNEEFTLTENSIEHKHKATPYLNKKLNGKIKHVFVNGIQVVNESEMNKKGMGKLLFNEHNKH